MASNSSSSNLESTINSKDSEIQSDKSKAKETKRLAAELALGKDLSHKSIEYESLRRLLNPFYHHQRSDSIDGISQQDLHQGSDNNSSLTYSFLGIDFETWEQGTNQANMTLEVGWSVSSFSSSSQNDMKNGKGKGKESKMDETSFDELMFNSINKKGNHFKQRSFHYLNQDLLHLRNGRFVADHKDHFIFGSNYDQSSSDISHTNSSNETEMELKIRNILGDGFGESFNENGSRVAKPKEIGLALNKTIDYLKNKGVLFIVFHDSSGDLKDLASLGVNCRSWKTNYPTSSKPNSQDLDLKTGQVIILDTQRYFSALMQQKSGFRLGKMAESCGIESEMKMSDMKLHNAANDAHVTLACLLNIAKGPPLKDFRPIFTSRLSKIEEEQKNWSKKRKKGFGFNDKIDDLKKKDFSDSKKGQANSDELIGTVKRNELLQTSSRSGLSGDW